jgi:hypothetical protein
VFAPDDPALTAIRRRSIRAERAQARSHYLRQALRAALVFGGLIAVAVLAFYLVENWTLILEAVLSAVDALRNS